LNIKTLIDFLSGARSIGDDETGIEGTPRKLYFHHHPLLMCPTLVLILKGSLGDVFFSLSDINFSNVFFHLLNLGHQALVLGDANGIPGPHASYQGE